MSHQNRALETWLGVQLFERSVQGAGYSALCVPGRERHPPVRAFFQWVQAQAKLSGQAL